MTEALLLHARTQVYYLFLDRPTLEHAIQHRMQSRILKAEILPFSSHIVLVLGPVPWRTP